ncbi:hypothetical protein SETIT_4G269600v2 [Setaria italica]|uniref:Uncharacterized protein n=1 Tax=Setaria italica TaxID=4555 RepID=A0A368QYN7_SETIT|nr:hypothetical protein SETIT_4G269600v2 [Setaria italica]
MEHLDLNSEGGAFPNIGSYQALILGRTRHSCRELQLVWNCSFLLRAPAGRVGAGGGAGRGHGSKTAVGGGRGGRKGSRGGRSGSRGGARLGGGRGASSSGGQGFNNPLDVDAGDEEDDDGTETPSQ